MPLKKAPTSTTRATKAKAPNKSQSGKSSKVTIDTIMRILYCKAIEIIDKSTRVLLFHDPIVPMAKPNDINNKDVSRDRYFDPIPTYHAPINKWLEHIHEMCFKAITTGHNVIEVTQVMDQIREPTLCPHLTNYTAHDDLIASLFHGGIACTQEQKEIIVRGYRYLFKSIVSLMFTYVMISGHKGLPSASSGYLPRMCSIGMFPQKLVDIARVVVDEMADSRAISKSSKSRAPTATKVETATASTTASTTVPEPEQFVEAAASPPEDEDELTEEDEHVYEDDEDKQ